MSENEEKALIPVNPEPIEERVSEAELEALKRGDPSAPKVTAAEIVRQLAR